MGFSPTRRSPLPRRAAARSPATTSSTGAAWPKSSESNIPACTREFSMSSTTCGDRRVFMRYNRISADCHLDLIWLPPDLFTSEAPAHLKDRMPYVAAEPDANGDRWWVAKNGVKFGIAGGVGA